ncbi:response regulator [Pseudobdellovibrio sp. HCB154]|uniref:response regulator n=1 Tax=Pseudobdellovibrio sp. HCB154 TaxID=3386277 RepID=UPI00391754C6
MQILKPIPVKNDHLSPSQHSNRLLIIDDALEMHSMLRTLLTEEGYIVHCVSNGQAALRYLRSVEELPGLIFLDLMMPIMDGYEFREAQLSDPRLAGTPVVIITADGHIESKKSKIKAIDSIKKPIDIDIMLQVIARYLNHG